MTRDPLCDRSVYGCEEVRLYEAPTDKVAEYDLKYSLGMTAEPSKFSSQADQGLKFTRNFCFEGNMAIW